MLCRARPTLESQSNNQTLACNHKKCQGNISAQQACWEATQEWQSCWMRFGMARSALKIRIVLFQLNKHQIRVTMKPRKKCDHNNFVTPVTMFENDLNAVMAGEGGMPLFKLVVVGHRGLSNWESKTAENISNHTACKTSAALSPNWSLMER